MCISRLSQCKMTNTKFNFSNLGMETLLNAPLHASQQRDTVSRKSVLLCCFIFALFPTTATATKWFSFFVIVIIYH